MTSSASEFAPVDFSTDDLPGRDRLAAWREHFARTVLGVDVALAPEAPVRATMALAALPGLSMVSGSLSAARYDRTPALIADANDDVYLDRIAILWRSASPAR